MLYTTAVGGSLHVWRWSKSFLFKRKKRFRISKTTSERGQFVSVVKPVAVRITACGGRHICGIGWVERMFRDVGHVCICVNVRGIDRICSAWYKPTPITVLPAAQRKKRGTIKYDFPLCPRRLFVCQRPKGCSIEPLLPFLVAATVCQTAAWFGMDKVVARQIYLRLFACSSFPFLFPSFDICRFVFDCGY